MNSYYNGFQRFPQLLRKYEYFPQRFPAVKLVLDEEETWQAEIACVNTFLSRAWGVAMYCVYWEPEIENEKMLMFAKHMAHHAS